MNKLHETILCLLICMASIKKWWLRSSCLWNILLIDGKSIAKTLVVLLLYCTGENITDSLLYAINLIKKLNVTNVCSKLIDSLSFSWKRIWAIHRQMLLFAFIWKPNCNFYCIYIYMHVISMKDVSMTTYNLKVECMDVTAIMY